MTMRDSTHLLRKLNPHCANATLIRQLMPELDRHSVEGAQQTAENPSISQAALFDAIHPHLVAHFQPAVSRGLLARMAEQLMVDFIDRNDAPVSANACTDDPVPPGFSA